MSTTVEAAGKAGIVVDPKPLKPAKKERRSDGSDEAPSGTGHLFSIPFLIFAVLCIVGCIWLTIDLIRGGSGAGPALTFAGCFVAFVPLACVN